MKILNWVLIVGFLFLDWLLFHDIFKAGETYTVADFLTGVLSIGVFVVCIKSIFTRNVPSQPDQHQVNDQA